MDIFSDPKTVFTELYFVTLFTIRRPFYILMLKTCREGRVPPAQHETSLGQSPLAPLSFTRIRRL